MMKEEVKSGKKNSKKLIIAIVIILVIAAIAFGFYKGIFSIPTGLMTASAATVTNGNQEATKNETPVPAQPAPTVTGTTIIEKNVSETLPYYEPIDLVDGRYVIYITTDKPVWIKLYDELHFNEWKNTGTQGVVEAGTNCCDEKDKTQNLQQGFQVSRGYGGTYYLLILGSEKTSINFKIIQTLKF